MATYAPQVGDLIQAHLISFLDKQTMMNSFLYTVGSRTAGSGGPTLDDVAKKLMAELWDSALLGLSQAVSLDVNNISLTAQVIKPIRTIASVATPLASMTGQTGSPALPSGVSIVCERKGTLAGRHNQGRIYIGGIAAADTAGSALVAGTPTQLGIAAFTGQMGSPWSIVVGGVTMVISPVLAPLPAGTPIVPITFVGWDDVLRYQRRRELRVGI